MSALEPGLYRATVKGVADTLVLLNEAGSPRWYSADEITDARPLIVLDLTHVQIGRFLYSLRATGNVEDRKIADQVEAQTKPARIPEPGLWGVVDATRQELNSSTRIDTQGRWVRVALGGCPWVHEGTKYTAEWDHLIDPTLIREGI